MEFRQLQYVIQIATEKNFSRAAEKLHIAQPSLSQQLSKLEKEIGVASVSKNDQFRRANSCRVCFCCQSASISWIISNS